MDRGDRGRKVLGPFRAHRGGDGQRAMGADQALDAVTEEMTGAIGKL